MKPSDRSIKRNITMSEVAAHAGVSRATVSRLLNNRESDIKITERTRQRVFDAIRELGYSPNRLAQGLVSRKKQVIGLSIPSFAPPDPSNPSWIDMHSTHIGKMVCGVQMVTHQRRYDIHLFERYEYQNEGSIAADDPRLDFVDGMVYATPNPEYPHYENILRSGLPLVFIGPNTLSLPVSSVSVDNTAVHQEITRCLVQAGHTRIGLLLAEPFQAPLSQLRLAGYQQALMAHGLPFCENYVLAGSFDVSHMQACARQIFEVRPAPTALIIGRPDFALHVAREMQRLKLRSPADVEVVVYGDDHAFEHMSPRLTAFDVTQQLLAEQATCMLFDELNGLAPSGRHLTLSGRLRIRDSSPMTGFFLEETPVTNIETAATTKGGVIGPNAVPIA